MDFGQGCPSGDRGFPPAARSLQSQAPTATRLRAPQGMCRCGIFQTVAAAPSGQQILEALDVAVTHCLTICLSTKLPVLPNAPSNQVARPGVGPASLTPSCPREPGWTHTEEPQLLHRAQGFPKEPRCAQNCSSVPFAALGGHWLSTSQVSKCHFQAWAGRHPPGLHCRADGGVSPFLPSVVLTFVNEWLTAALPVRPGPGWLMRTGSSQAHRLGF